jgi:hypothetical protein
MLTFAVVVKGTALLFWHGASPLSPEHEGSACEKGKKYVLRSGNLILDSEQTRWSTNMNLRYYVSTKRLNVCKYNLMDIFQESPCEIDLYSLMIIDISGRLMNETYVDHLNVTNS